MIKIEELVEVGAHFGHPTSRWNPNFLPYIASKKNGIHIINLKETNACLSRAVIELEKIVQANGTILFVGTKKQAKDVVQKAADSCGMYYIVERWLGGTLTNFATIKRSIRRLASLEKESSPIYQNLTKKEINMLRREKLKLADLHRGIKDMKHLPSALFFIDGIHEKIAIDEAKTLGIPVFGLVDTNTDPTMIDYPIPSNDDSMKTINLILTYVSNSINAARGGVLDYEDEDTSNVDQVINDSVPSDESHENDLSKTESSNDEAVEGENK